MDDGLKLVGTCLTPHARLFHEPPLARRVQQIHLAEPTFSETGAILGALLPQLAEHHRLTIDVDLIPVCLKAVGPLPGRFPAKAILLLDEAASSMALLGSSALTAADIHAAANRFAENLPLQRRADA